MKVKVNIDLLIEIVSRGGTLKTGVDVYNQNGLLLIDKDLLINNVNTLLNIKKNGVSEVAIVPDNAGGLWDYNGKEIDFGFQPGQTGAAVSTVEKKLRQITALKKEARIKYDTAKQNIKQVILDIRKTGGEFDYETVEKTVTDLLNFLTVNETAFSYLTKEIFSYDDYLYNHSINVCTIALAVLNRFNMQFSETVNRFLSNTYLQSMKNESRGTPTSYILYLPDDIRDIALGYFLHDVGKVLIADEILNKHGQLTPEEFEIVKHHSFDKGRSILERNGLEKNPLIRSSVQFHHCALFSGEPRCYPDDKTPIEVPIFVKICKLADIYDAMTTKRVYKEALNPIVVVTEIFRKYAEKESLLQFVLHSFVKVVGIYPAGSIVSLQNGQMAFVVDSSGPLVIPFTDNSGKSLQTKQEAVNLENVTDQGLQIDRRKPLTSPVDAYELLPDYLRQPADVN
ncbi:MAG: HD-GYP domain-containing protein [Thermodesulfobacteriota bacterium]